MRQDARSLLERLGQRGFQYRDFADPASEIELWPFFEAVLRDNRVVGAAQSRIPVIGPRETPRPKSAAPRPAVAPTSIFSAYDSAPRAEPKDGGPDVRSFLDRLSGREA